jgi:arsenite methyltransferase
MAKEPTSFEIVEAVREHYALAARKVAARKKGPCCSGATSCCSTTSAFYAAEELQGLPDSAANASFGCGNPLLLAQLRPGEVVLDLGSGAGLDVILSARRVAPSGKAYGLDMTDEMLELARGNAREAGVDNIEFLKGYIEAIPLPDDSVDVIISNCVINLSPDKSQVFREAYRVLRPGGLLAISDIITDAPLPDAVRESLNAWAGCVGGALDVESYLAALKDAGFDEIEIARKYFEREEIQETIQELGLEEQAKDGHHIIIRAGDDVHVLDLGEEVNRDALPRTFSGKVKARKPQG